MHCHWNMVVRDLDHPLVTLLFGLLMRMFYFMLLRPIFGGARRAGDSYPGQAFA